MTSVCCAADDSEEENLDSDLGQVGNHAFARMEADVDKQRKQILQGQMSEAAAQKQHQRKYGGPPPSTLNRQRWPGCRGNSSPWHQRSFSPVIPQLQSLAVSRQSRRSVRHRCA